MKVKKIVSIFLMSVMALGLLTGCGSDTKKDDETDSTQQEQEINQDDSDVENTEETINAENTSQSSESNILIAYFSVPEDIDTDGIDADAGASVVVKDGEIMGNMQYMAQTIQDTVGGDLFRIETAEQYPLDHDPLVDQAAEEQDEDARPELSSHIENADQYDTILLGFSNWLAYHNLIQCTQA